MGNKIIMGVNFKNLPLSFQNKYSIKQKGIQLIRSFVDKMIHRLHSCFWYIGVALGDHYLDGFNQVPCIGKIMLTVVHLCWPFTEVLRNIRRVLECAIVQFITVLMLHISYTVHQALRKLNLVLLAVDASVCLRGW